jgi:hypothetical protein
MGHLLKIKCAHSRVNENISASTSVPFRPMTVKVPNLALAWHETDNLAAQSNYGRGQVLKKRPGLVNPWQKKSNKTIPGDWLASPSFSVVNQLSLLVRGDIINSSSYLTKKRLFLPVTKDKHWVLFSTEYTQSGSCHHKVHIFLEMKQG